MGLKRKSCALCRVLRVMVLSIVLGGSAGIAVLYAGGSQTLSMLATFFAALGPVMWWARRNRIEPKEPR